MCAFLSAAAYVMYEHGLRLGREAPGPKSLHKQVRLELLYRNIQYMCTAFWYICTKTIVTCFDCFLPVG